MFFVCFLFFVFCLFVTNFETNFDWKYDILYMERRGINVGRTQARLEVCPTKWSEDIGQKPDTGGEIQVKNGHFERVSGKIKGVNGMGTT